MELLNTLLLLCCAVNFYLVLVLSIQIIIIVYNRTIVCCQMKQLKYLGSGKNLNKTAKTNTT